MKPRILLALAAALVLSLAPLHAQAPPNLLHLQARLADAAGADLQGPVAVDVRVYDAFAGGVLLWSEAHAATATDGVVGLLLGSVTPFPADLFDGDRWLTLAVQGDLEMTPRKRIVSVAYARRAQTAETAVAVGADAVGSGSIADGAVGTADLADGAVTGAKLAPGATDPGPDSVGSAEIVDGAVATADLSFGAVTGDKIQDGTITGGDLFDSAVTASKLAPDAVGSLNLQDGAVTQAKIAEQSVSGDKLAAGSVDAVKILDGSVATADLADKAVTGQKIAVGAVDGGHIAPLAVGGAHIAPQSVSIDKLAFNSVDTKRIVDGTILALDLAAGAVDGTKIADGSIANADVSATAAIAGSKVVPAFGAQTISTTDRIGIGTASPAQMLHLSSLGGIEVFVEADTNNSGEDQHASILLSQDGGNVQSLIGYANSTNRLSLLNLYADAVDLGTGGTAHLTIDSAGEVGIGTTSPTAKLHVVGAAGDGTVVLPDDAIGPDEVLAEPGIAHAKSTSSTSFGDPIQSIATRSITAPTDGFVVAMASANVSNFTDPTEMSIFFGISELPTAFTGSLNKAILKFLGFDTLTSHAVFPVTAGTHTFHIVAELVVPTPGAAASVQDRELTLMFFPTSYGVVTGS